MNARSTELPRDAPPGAVLLAASAMGTRFELVLPDDGSTEAHRRCAAEAALAEVIDLDSRLSLFRKDSLLAHLNREAARGTSGQPVRLDDDTFALLSICVEVWRDSNGAFDATVAPLMRQWGLHIDSVLPPAAPLPICGPEGCTIPGDSPARHDITRSDTGAIDLDIEAKSVRFAAPIALDLGGIAKGFALDIATRTLRESGIEHAFLQGGTSAIAALGVPRPGDGTARNAWRVAIEVPEHAAPDGSVTIAMRDMAMCVSAHHGRTAEGRGHIIDPSTSAPASGASTAPAAEVAAVVAHLATNHALWPCASADAWTKPVLLSATRPALLPSVMTTIVVSDHDIAISGPHASTISDLSRSRT